ncbi:MAG: alpha/beta hydrolase [Bacteroidales bacterium]|nr:alpha/beta hydrolase [Bacteroidales bacterium]
MKPQIIKNETGTIEYILEGEGKTVLFIHGGNDDCRTEFKQQHLIENGYQVLAPSRPGYGNTSVEFGKTAAEQAEFLKILLDSIKIEKVAVIGNSAGGPTALEFAKRYPAHTACLILEEAISKNWVSKFTPTYYGMKYMLHPKRQSKLWGKMRAEFESNQQKHLLRLCKMFSTLKAAYVLEDWTDDDIKDYEKYLLKCSSGYGFINDIDHKAKDIHLITVPTLISHSPFDKNVPFSHAIYAHKKIKNSRLFIAPAKSHLNYQGKDAKYIIDKRLSFLKETGW